MDKSPLPSLSEIPVKEATEKILATVGALSNAPSSIKALPEIVREGTPWRFTMLPLAVKVPFL